MNKTTLLSLVATTAIVSGVQAEDSDWNSSFDLGYTFTQGNSDNTFLTLGFVTSKKETINEYFGALSYTYGDSADETTTNELIGAFSWNRLLTERTYAGLRFDLRTDELADIDYRTGLSGIIGHYYIKNSTTYLAFEGGIGFTVEQVGGESDTYANAYVGDRFEHKFNDKTRVYQTLSITSPLDDFEDYSLVAEVGVETFLSGSLALKVYAQDKYESQPAGGLAKNDIKVVTGISYKF